MSERLRRLRTCSPRGQTPMLQYHYQLAEAIGHRRHDLVELLLPALPWRHSRPQVVDFRGHLLRCLPGKLLVVWDGLPGYAPELSPVEYLWGY